MSGWRISRVVWQASVVIVAVVTLSGLIDVASTSALASFAASHRPVNKETSVPKGLAPVGVGPDASPPSPGWQYFYAKSYELATTTGSFGTFLVEDPAVSIVDGHSLAEMSVESNDGSQVIEVGWTVDPGQFGDTLPHLFVFHWVNGVPACYDGCGFVQVSATVTPGKALSAGESDVFEIAYADSNWNVYYNGALVGYFPGSLWSGSFTSLGLTQWFGEVAAGSSVPCSQMGSGAFAGADGADTINGMGFVDGPTASITVLATNDAYYSAEATSPDSMSFGGPGGCAATSATITSTSSSTPVVGQSVDVTVSVVGPSTAPGANTPTGSVTVSAGSNSCQASLTGSNGTAVGTCSIIEEVPGNYSLTASYSGDSAFDSSETSISKPLTVGKATSSTTLLHLTPKVTYGDEEAEQLAVEVWPEFPGSLPSGTVRLKDATTILCTIALSSSCRLSARRLPVGTYGLVAAYGGDSDFYGSVSPIRTLTVVKASAKTSLRLSTAYVSYGDEGAEQLGVAVSPEFAGAMPSGRVTVKESRTVVCEITLSSGKGSCDLSAKKLKAGTYRLVATYGGNREFNSSSSISKTLNVTE